MHKKIRYVPIFDSWKEYVTVIITGNSGYIPSRAAYDYRSYEADTGYYARGTAEKLAEQYVEMLKALG